MKAPCKFCEKKFHPQGMGSHVHFRHNNSKPAAAPASTNGHFAGAPPRRASEIDTMRTVISGFSTLSRLGRKYVMTAIKKSA